jgi:hypothetical protein
MPRADCRLQRCQASEILISLTSLKSLADLLTNQLVKIVVSRQWVESLSSKNGIREFVDRPEWIALKTCAPKWSKTKPILNAESFQQLASFNLGNKSVFTVVVGNAPHY